MTVISNLLKKWNFTQKYTLKIEIIKQLPVLIDVEGEKVFEMSDT